MFFYAGFSAVELVASQIVLLTLKWRLRREEQELASCEPEVSKRTALLLFLVKARIDHPLEPVGEIGAETTKLTTISSNDKTGEVPHPSCELNWPCMQSRGKG